METFVLDTGILIGYLRGAPYAEKVDAAYAPTKSPNLAVISIVTAAELESFTLHRNWGKDKRDKLTQLLSLIPSTPVAHSSLVHMFAEVDAFNHRKHPSRKLVGSARAMGDNDIWIAATASVLKATLLTTDHDFDHLDGHFCKVIYVDPH